MEKINESESWFFEKIRKIEKPLVRGIKKKRKRAQVHKIGNEKKKKQERNDNGHHRNTKNHKRLLRTAIYH